MSSYSFGNSPTTDKTSKEFINEIYEIVGDNFPVKITVIAGQVTYFTFDSTWKEGTTTPRETRVEQPDGTYKTVIEYEEDYTEKQLTAEQIAQIEQWATANIASE